MERWIPEIVYEENEDGSSSSIPFIMVPDNEVMPGFLFVFESRDTNIFEPGLDGEDVPVIEWDLHQYANMKTLKENLDEITFDLVRAALGLESLATATKKGKAVSSSIREKVTTSS
tara:strand:+ start:152 stop:499 length:348 start_codon:yes stop_codon:yes gene_type:complete